VVAILDVILEWASETIIRKPLAQLDDANKEGSPRKLVGDPAQVLLLVIAWLVPVCCHKACSIPVGDAVDVPDWLDSTGHILVVLLQRLNCGSMKPAWPLLAT
jgi:hypothetical protein